MIRLRAARVFSLIATVLAVAMVIPLAASVALAAQAPVGDTTSLVIFPYENTTSAGGKEIGGDVAAAVRSWLGFTSAYSSVVFSPKAPSMERATREKRVEPADLEGPFDKDKALKLGKELGAEMVLIGSIDDYNYNATEKTVDVTLTTQLYKVKTGDEVKTVALTGKGKAAPGGADESILAGKAIEDAVGQTVKSFGGVTGGPAATVTAGTTTKKKGGFWSSKGVWVLLIGAIVAGVALATGGSKPTGTGTDNPPPPPL